ncbi:lysozyme family protein [Caulobacter rhizosphaerae]|nr:lysozyme family protein [Caulobacter rhizosphaerae]
MDLSRDVHGDPDAPVAAPASRGGLESSPPWRIAEALEALREQINTLAPARDKASDGGVGDAAHRARSSDHNPWVVDGAYGVVTARDFTHSPGTGCDAGVLAEGLRASRDPRIKYIIWNRRICASEPRDGQAAWAWRPYGGTNPHDHHVHVSVQPLKALYDDPRAFAITSVSATPSALPVARAEPGLEIAAIAAAANQLAQLTPLLQRLIDLKESPDLTVAAQAGPLLSRYLELTQPRSAPAGSDGLRLGDLTDEYERLFSSCQIRPEWAGQVSWHRKKLLAFQPRYVAVGNRARIPWWVIGAIHAMEGGFDFATHLHNGDPLTGRTVRVPAGRPIATPPPYSWEESALDALTGHDLAGLEDWSVPATLFRLERYNGFGSRRKGINTPYLWSFSNHYSKGKFVRDGVYDPEAISKQCGAAVMLKTLADHGDIAIRGLDDPAR